jgi:hypothetical protein
MLTQRAVDRDTQYKGNNPVETSDLIFLPDLRGFSRFVEKHTHYAFYN